MSVLREAYEAHKSYAVLGRERLQAALPPVPKGMRWQPVLELADVAGYQIRLYDESTRIVYGGSVAYTFVDFADAESLARALRMKTHGWVEHLLTFRPWAGVMALVSEIKSDYFWKEHGAQLRDEDDEEDDEEDDDES